MGAQPPDATIVRTQQNAHWVLKPRREAGGGPRGNWCPRETHSRCHRPESTVIFRLCRKITQRQPPRQVHRGASPRRSGGYASGRVHRGASSHRSGTYASWSGRPDGPKREPPEAQPTGKEHPATGHHLVMYKRGRLTGAPKPRRRPEGAHGGTWCPRETHRRGHLPAVTVICEFHSQITPRHPPRRVHRGASSHRSGSYASG